MFHRCEASASAQSRLACAQRGGTPECMVSLRFIVCVCSAVPMAVTSLCSVLLGLLGMKLVDVPMFFTLRRLVTPTIILYEYTALGKIPQRDVLLAIGVSTLGTMIAAAPTLSADMLAYLVVIATNFFTAANMAFQKKYRDETSASVLTTVLINSLLTLPVTGTLALLTGEVTNLVHFEYVTHAGFWLSFVAAATMGLILTFAAMLNTTYNSPIATSVTGNVKDIATSLVGWILFPGFKSSVPAVAGILLSFLGAFMYSYANLVRSLAVASGSKDTAGQVLHAEATAHKLNSSAVAAALDSSRLTTSPAGHASSTVPLQMPRFEKMHAHSKLV
ncbi:hypothetical protein EON66_00140 [archaeon]|nr:MAG: hypothetical protein EON66_00140 [archaeon]